MTVKQAIELLKSMPSSIMTKEDVLGLLRTMDGAHSVYGMGVSDIADINEDDEDEVSQDHLRAQIEDAIATAIEFDDYVSPDDVELSLQDNCIQVDRINVDDGRLIGDITDVIMQSLEEVFIIKNKN